MSRGRSSLLALSTVVALLAGCGSAGGTSDGRLRVEASFYPLQWIAQQVGGDAVEVGSLTKAGAEPHDLELTPKDVAAVVDADLVVYLSGFQPSVDEAVGQTDEAKTFDARGAAGIDLTYTTIEDGKEGADDAASSDPHFWLDPTRLAKVADALAKDLSARDPEQARLYRANAHAVIAKLRALDQRYRDALEGCKNTDLVTSHDAFGYLARRYGLRQVGISGLTPDAEPTPGELARTARFVEQHDVRTIYFETLASPATAKAVAAEAGVKTAVLDPIEGLNDTSQGSDYLEVMASNLRNIIGGQPCP